VYSFYQVCGPMWLGPLHEREFIDELITTVEAEKDNYGTFARMKGMLTMAREVSFKKWKLVC
jgi:tRNA (guanine26-N2/guanine27-N2)-dimethyltransferase